MAAEDWTFSPGTGSCRRLKASPNYRLTVSPDHIFWQQVTLTEVALGQCKQPITCDLGKKWQKQQNKEDCV